MIKKELGNILLRQSITTTGINIIALGLIFFAFSKLKCMMKYIDRVIPHPGHGMSNNCLMIHKSFLPMFLSKNLSGIL